ncbi:radical SAM protein [Desulfoferrobacter suflitae]|uniref:radical SAM protein n=1 Tax=Desulfoferrobacter suflitae TaxID=2865782 RepID=UPI002164B7EC|nr:radical SAM/SPASM domain-containing protein [Desulfoferrobacter suflitae]MCK8603715.1 radical SAM protein [Desulfoferrobacter suflitae]
MSDRNFRQALSKNLMKVGLKNNLFRRQAVEKAERALEDYIVSQNADHRPQKVQEMRFLGMRNLLRSGARALARGRICDAERRSLLDTFVEKFVIADPARTETFQLKHGYEPPGFLIVSPTEKCNLRCTGCYAAARASKAKSLSYSVLQRVIREKTELWGSHFTVVSGGEAWLYRSEGKDLWELLQQNADNYFLVFTNGTLITRQVARRMADLGNVTPAISVEGFKEETDARRGQGVFQSVLEAMENLRGAGVPFGISVTATRNNAELIVSESFVRFFFDLQGAAYGWIFQYMPIGRSYTFDLVVTPEQRLFMLQRQMQLLRERELFYIDFWNGGPMSVGCIAAGRPGGYLHIDWNGNVAPCVFFPYYVDNIHDIYRKNGSISSVLESELFCAIRGWQAAYGYAQPPDRVQNLFRPCPIRDHYGFAYHAIQTTGARPLNKEAADALADSQYRGCMLTYDQRLAELLDPCWQVDVLSYDACC